MWPRKGKGKCEGGKGKGKWSEEYRLARQLMQLLRYGGPKGTFKSDQGEWTSAATLAVEVGTDPIKIIMAAGQPDDDFHRFRFYADRTGAVYLKAKNKADHGGEEVYAAQGPRGEERREERREELRQIQGTAKTRLAR
jgi:hypothetical protein